MSDRIVATVQARMGSSRLPGKVLRPIVEKPALELLLERLSRADEVDEIVVATTKLKEDDAIADLASALGHPSYRGPSEDVLARLVGAAASRDADVVVQITGDCVLTCPSVVDRAVVSYRCVGCDYLSNLMVQTYPQGVDVRVFRYRDLEEIHRDLAGDDYWVREHAYLYFEDHPERYDIHVMKAPPEHRRPEWRLDLDYEEDLSLLREIFRAIYPSDRAFTLDGLIRFLDAHPELRSMNAGMPRKPLRPDSDSDQGR